MKFKSIGIYLICCIKHIISYNKRPQATLSVLSDLYKNLSHEIKNFENFEGHPDHISGSFYDCPFYIISPDIFCIDK